MMRVGAGRIFSAGLALLLAGSWLAAGSFYAALLPWKIGVWVETEPMVIALHGAALLCTIGLAMCMTSRPTIVGRAVSHPAVLAALFVAVWSAVASSFVAWPVLSLLGTPQLGEGALYYADAAAFLATGSVLYRLPRARRWFVWPGIAVCVATPLVVASAERIVGESWWLFVFDDYLAWYAVAGCTLVLVLDERRAFRRWGLAALVAAPGLALSGNLSAVIVFVAIAFPFAALLAVWLRRPDRPLWPPRLVLMAAVPSLAGAGVLAVWYVGEAGWVASLTSRLFAFRALLQALAEAPAVIAVGQGWGQINNAVLLHLVGSGAVIWDGSWDLSVRDIPHSHNFAIEAFAGAGLPALVGVAVMFAAIPAVAGRRALPATAFATLAFSGLAALWFQLPATSGLMMLALGAASGLSRRRFFRPRLSRAAVVATCGTVAAMQATALVWLVDYGVAAQRAIAAGYRSPEADRCGTFPDDSGRGSIGLTRQFGTTFDKLFTDLAAGQAAATANTEERWNRLMRLYCVVTERAASGNSARLMLADQLFRGQIALTPYLQDEAYRFADALESWQPSLERFIAGAPDRTDVAAPYLAWRLVRGEPSSAIEFSEWLLRRNADDPIGHWFLGAGLAASGKTVSDGDKQRILSHMRRALALGLGRRIKVDPALSRFLEPGRADALDGAR